MELKKWAKILLASYSVFETMAGVLDKYIETRALNSMKSTLLTAESNSATRVCHDLGIMMVRKIDIINLKVLIDNGLDSMLPKYARALILKYFDGLTSAEIAETMEISVRSVARYQELGIESLANYFRNLGYDAKKLCKLCGSNSCFLDFHEDPLLFKVYEFSKHKVIKAHLASMVLERMF